MPWVTINGAHVLVGEDDGSGPSKTEKAVQKAKGAKKLVACRECERKVVPRGHDVCGRKECRDSFAAGLKQWRRMYGVRKKDLPAMLGVKKYLGNAHPPKASD